MAFDLRREYVNCSGHASRNDLKAIAKEIKTKKLFPVHTEFLEMFIKLVPIILKEGKTHTLE